MALKHSNDRRRQMLIQTAARIMAEEGVQDFLLAKQKAVERLRWPDLCNLPSNQEVASALHSYRCLFQAEQHKTQLHTLRTTALEALRFLTPFEACLVGPVLSGNVSLHDPIYLHVFAASSEEVALFLAAHNIPVTLAERNVRYGREQVEVRPVFRFWAGAAAIEITVFPATGLRRAPLSPIDGKPMLRANADRLAELIAAS